PAITDSGVTIDATTQPGGGGHGIRLDDPDAGGGESGLVIQAQSATIRGFAITRFESFGIMINGSAGNTITGNWIGTADGASPLGTGAAAIHVDGGASNTISNNVVSAALNGSDGIDLHNSNNNVVTGNYVGMTP